MKRPLLAAALAAVSLAAGAAGVARAASSSGPTLELSVIQATKTDGAVTVDPQIRDLPQGQKPFNDYNVFRLLDRRALHLDPTKPLSFPLVNGRTVLVVLDGVTDAAQRRYQLETQISEAGKADYLKSLHVTASENQAFFVGGQSYGGGTLFLELVVRP
ncbi:MAG TPA: hypothetical protein VIF09_12255 [Polyangiaceae bacterium]